MTLAQAPIAVPALTDNYVWYLRDGAGAAVVVDPGEAAPVEHALARHGDRLVAILITHHHPDHVGGVPALLAHRPVPVHAPDDARIPGVTHRLYDGARVALPLGIELEVIAVPGHTLSHVALHGDGMLFCGDTLFSVGCGRLFEGTPAQMLASLDRLARLPHDTRVHCGHEYTLANCAFALGVEPANAALAARRDAATAARREGHPTLPSTLGSELACNPFLRVDQPAVRAACAARGASGDRVATFAALRRWKDGFRADAPRAGR